MDAANDDHVQTPYCPMMSDDVVGQDDDGEAELASSSTCPSPSNRRVKRFVLVKRSCGSSGANVFHVWGPDSLSGNVIPVQRIADDRQSTPPTLVMNRVNCQTLIKLSAIIYYLKMFFC